METKHTPGPWFLGMREGHNGCMIYDRSGMDQFTDRTIAQVYGLYSNQPVEKQPDEEYLANARLIAAAPELLEALQYALHVRGTTEDGPHVVAIIEAAIAKATGE